MESAQGVRDPESPQIAQLAKLGKDVIILGHTHVAMVARIDGVTVINPGSVGQPPLEDPRPAHALMETETGEVRIEKIDFSVGEKCLRIVRPETGW